MCATVYNDKLFTFLNKDTWFEGGPVASHSFRMFWKGYRLWRGSVATHMSEQPFCNCHPWKHSIGVFWKLHVCQGLSGGQWPLPCSCYRAFLSSVMPSRWLSQALQQNAKAHSIPKKYTIYNLHTHTHTSFQPPLVEDMAPAIHALVVPSAAMRPRPHKGWDPRKPKLNCLTFNFPLKNRLRRPSLCPHIYIYIVLYLYVPQISDVWGKHSRRRGWIA